ncbi:MAG: hypothetical protein MNPFHGCM_01089 [Gemmatimonadaceae bacterium]|nr:hypothetical protein [Gemmatimonadaceae bacterium]
MARLPDLNGGVHTGSTGTDAAPRRSGLIASAVFALCTLALGFPALAGKFLVNPYSDQYIAGYAFREFAAATLKATGGFPQWNPYLFGGMPYVAAMHGDIFYPTFLLRLVMPTDMAMTWGFMIHLFLAGICTYAFLRALGIGFFASMVGGVAYMLSGNVAALVSPGHDGKLFISALLPIILLVVTRLVRDGKPWAFGALAFAVGMAVLTPHPQLLQYLLLAAGAFGLLLGFADVGEGKLTRRVAMRRLGLAAAAVVTGGLIGAIQFLPVREYVAWSPRATGKGWEDATSFSMPPEEMINFLLPQFSGILDRYWGRNGIHLHSEYLGVTVIPLVALAFGRDSSRRTLLWFWAGTLAVTLLWALGGNTPFYRLVYAVVPGTRFFRAPSTILYLVSFSIAVLAALGAERALRGEITRRFMMGWLVVLAGIALTGIAGGLTNLGVAIAGPDRTDAIVANTGALQAGAFRMFVFAAFLFVTLFMVQTRRLSRDMRGVLLIGVIAIDLWSVARLYWSFSEPASKLYASDSILDEIVKSTKNEPGRVLSLQLAPSQAVHDPYLWGDGLMVHRIRSVLGYHGNELGRFQQLGEKQNQWRQIANPNFWRLLNVRYFLTNVDDVGIPSLKRLQGPIRNAAGTETYLFELPERHPLAWVAPVIVKAGDEAVLATVLDPRFDVRAAALFDSASAVIGKTIDQLPAPLTTTVKTLAYAPGQISLELSDAAPEGSALVVSENYYPGWRATVDGKPAAVSRADVTLMGVPLPSGAKRIDLVFSSDAYHTGKWITLVALGGSLLACLAGVIQGRTRGE